MPRRPNSRLKRTLFFGAIVWAAPYTAIGLFVGTIGLLTGGHVQRKGCAWEFYGGAVNPFLKYICGPWVSAITFGHTILGQNAELLEACREHEWVHVRQYERWGPLFGPAYVASSVYVWLQGKRAYRDNHFEREAYGDDKLEVNNCD